MTRAVCIHPASSGKCIGCLCWLGKICPNKGKRPRQIFRNSESTSWALLSVSLNSELLWTLTSARSNTNIYTWHSLNPCLGSSQSPQFSVCHKPSTQLLTSCHRPWLMKVAINIGTSQGLQATDHLHRWHMYVWWRGRGHIWALLKISGDN